MLQPRRAFSQVSLEPPQRRLLVLRRPTFRVEPHDVRELLDSLVRRDNLIVADFSSAAFVDSSILGVLLDTEKQASELGKTFRLQLGTAAIVRRAFEIAGLFDVIERVTTREEALVREEQ